MKKSLIILLLIVPIVHAGWFDWFDDLFTGNLADLITGKSTNINPDKHQLNLVEHKLLSDRSITMYDHTQVVSNENGIFMYLIEYNLLYDQTNNYDDLAPVTRKLLRSTDEGNTFSVIYEDIVDNLYQGLRIETDKHDNVYLFDTSGVLYKFSPQDNYNTPQAFTLPNVMTTKSAILYDSIRDRLYLFLRDGQFLIVGLDCQVISSYQLITPGDFAFPQYPYLSLDENGVLYAAWANQRYNTGNLYHSIHFMRSLDRGVSWQKLDGTSLSLPVVCDNSGPADMINLEDEFDGQKTLWSFLAKNGKIHFAYYMSNGPQVPQVRTHYVRYDVDTAREDKRIQPIWKGNDITLKSLYYGFAVSDPTDQNKLYWIAQDFDRGIGKLAVLYSDNNGDNWYDYAKSDISEAELSYISYLNGFHKLTKDGDIIGVHTGTAGTHIGKIYFFKIGVDSAPVVCTDSDGDGYGIGCVNGLDCDDNNPNINPSSDEICDGVDNDCNTNTEDGSGDITSLNSKQVGVCASSTKRCDGVNGWVDDYSSVANYESNEVSCDNLDNDCDNSVDEGSICFTISYYCDFDNDGYTSSSVSNACNSFNCLPNGCSKTQGNDCNDNLPDVHPDADDSVCNGLDNDCINGIDDDYVSIATSCGVGSCSGNTGEMVCVNGDEQDTCDPFDGAVAESCEDNTGYDNQDNNCDGNVDLDCDSYCDQDGDEYSSHLICALALYKTGDCDDSDASRNPGEDELCDGRDNNCDDNDEGSDEVWFGSPCDGSDSDLCNEGTFICSNNLKVCTDLSDDNVEVCDGDDNDCDSDIDEGCECINGNTKECGSDIGECSKGLQTCSQGNWGSCQGGKDPETEICGNNIDEDCDGEDLICLSSCGDGTCDDANEDCFSCEQDCLESGQICCDSVTYTGDCCSNDDCSGSKVCVAYSCGNDNVDTDNDGVFDSKDRCPNTPIGKLVNKKGCVKPRTNKFKLNNLDDEDLKNAKLNISKGNKARIEFLEDVDIEDLDLDDVIEVKDKNITIRSNRLNKSAKLIFYNINYNNPQVYKDGSLCLDCSIGNYNKDDEKLTIEVPGFSSYTIEEGPYCGDDSCNGDETCSICSADCGSCPAGGSPGGGGGSGGRSYRSVVEVSCSQVSYNCGDWDECNKLEYQSRVCTNITKCNGDEFSKIDVDSRNCEYKKEDISEESIPIIVKPKSKQIKYLIIISSIIIIISLIAYFLFRTKEELD